ncbi:MAG: hypothetical protein ABSE62_06370 [Chthoniobacteraceae bacterium]|jgi:hypothetical protein
MQTNQSWRAALVVTTINKGGFLEDYYQAILREELLDRVTVIVIPDRKTPPELLQLCGEYASKGLRILCPMLSEQEEYLAKIDLTDFIPYNSDNRRNIGYLMALEMGCEMLVSIDDDNYCRPADRFFNEHAVVCQVPVQCTSVSSSTRWFNICDLMEVQPTSVWPRGTPYKYRHQKPAVTRQDRTVPVKMNAGLWLGEPDLDAITWLVAPVRASGFKGESVLLDDGTWSAINTQNTALHRDLIPAYYFIPMNHPLGPGLSIDRFGDIFSGFFAEACAKHLGHGIRVGTPVADHRRNSHNYMRDAGGELGCIWVLEDLMDWLVELKLEGGTYSETYLSLAEALAGAAERFTGFAWTDATRTYFRHMVACMRRWVNACARWV